MMRSNNSTVVDNSIIILRVISILWIQLLLTAGVVNALDDIVHNFDERRNSNHYSEREILESFFRSTGGATNWIIQDNWLSDTIDVCYWYGVTCNSTSGRVQGLSLVQNGLTGRPTSRIFHLEELRVLFLDGNDIDFRFGGIEHAQSLQEIGLANTFTSSAVGLRNIDNNHNNALSLVVLDLSNTRVRHPSINEVFSVTSLLELNLGFNNLGRGRWATNNNMLSRIDKLSNLISLQAPQAGISGRIPTSIGKLIKLESLVLSGNKISGTLPKELDALTNLRVLEIQSNQQISGSLPSFSNCTLLHKLDVSNNSLSGPIPENFLEKFSNLSVTIDINLSSNEFVDSLPPSLSRFDALNIDVTGNNMTHIPDVLCNRSNWMNRNVDLYGCDAIMCPPLSYNSQGRQVSNTSICLPCNTSQFFGMRRCPNKTVEELVESSTCPGDETLVCHNGGNCIETATSNDDIAPSTKVKCECPTGFYGRQCDYAVADTNNDTDQCSLECHNGGHCRFGSADFSVLFPTFFSDTSNSLPTFLEQRQVDDMFCFCPYGYTGVRCEIEVDWCDRSQVCFSGGKCQKNLTMTTFNNEIGTYCNCSGANRKGRFCEQDPTVFCPTNSSTTAFCTNGGLCRHQRSWREQEDEGCICPEGYRGEYCEFVMDEDSSTQEERPSLMDGSAGIVSTNMSVTTCPDGQISCLNGGSCVPIKSRFPWYSTMTNSSMMRPSYFCDCTGATVSGRRPVAGHQCEHIATAICDGRNGTASSFCTNGGQCIHDSFRLEGEEESHYSYSRNRRICDCLDGFEGDHCEFSKGSNYSVPISVDADNSYEGVCPDSQICYNGGICAEDLNSPGNYLCDCSSAIINGMPADGAQCEFPATSICNHGAGLTFSSFCTNGGRCAVGARNHSELSIQGTLDNCVCLEGFEGNHCQFLVDSNRPSLEEEFLPVPINHSSVTCPDGHTCFNGGSCTEVPRGSGSYYCDCNHVINIGGNRRTIFAGLHCEHQADEFCNQAGIVDSLEGTPSFCTNGGTCKEVAKSISYGHVGCDCPPGYEGEYCQFLTATMPHSWPTIARIINHQPASNVCYLHDGVELICENGGICVYDAEVIFRGSSNYKNNSSFNEGVNGALPNPSCDCRVAAREGIPYAGLRCEYEATSICNSGPPYMSYCMNGGICIKNSGPGEAHGGCLCGGSFEGEFCQIVKFQNTDEFKVWVLILPVILLTLFVCFLKRHLDTKSIPPPVKHQEEDKSIVEKRASNARSTPLPCHEELAVVEKEIDIENALIFSKEEGERKEKKVVCNEYAAVAVEGYEDFVNSLARDTSNICDSGSAVSETLSAQEVVEFLNHAAKGVGIVCSEEENGDNIADLLVSMGKSSTDESTFEYLASTSEENLSDYLASTSETCQDDDNCSSLSLNNGSSSGRIN